MCMRLHLTQNGRWMFHEGSDTDPNANEFWTVQVDIIYNCDFLKKYWRTGSIEPCMCGSMPYICSSVLTHLLLRFGK